MTCRRCRREALANHTMCADHEAQLLSQAFRVPEDRMNRSAPISSGFVRSSGARRGATVGPRTD